MEHKAFLFDFVGFSEGLRPILVDALGTGDSARLMTFISDNIAVLSDPYEGEPLGGDWRDMIETRDPHQYGDFALTKYYSPPGDIGLGFGWEKVQAVLGGIVKEGESPILGVTLEVGGIIFDPGKMGSYFQSGQRVSENLRALEYSHGEFGSICDAPIEMLRMASAAEKGLYVTF